MMSKMSAIILPLLSPASLAVREFSVAHNKILLCFPMLCSFCRTTHALPFTVHNNYIVSQKIQLWWFSGKASPANAGDMGLIPGPGRSPWRRKWQPALQYSCLRNSVESGAWWATVHGFARESDMT